MVERARIDIPCIISLRSIVEHLYLVATSTFCQCLEVVALLINTGNASITWIDYNFERRVLHCCMAYSQIACKRALARNYLQHFVPYRWNVFHLDQ